MSSDEAFVVEVLAALREAELEALVVGSVAGVLQGATVTTDDLDVLVRDTPRTREKIRAVAALLSTHIVALSPLTGVLRLPTARAHLDVLFDEIPGPLTFESIRSRSIVVQVGPEQAVVASLEDLIRSKEAAGRPKDLAQLPVLRDALKVRRALGR